MIRETTPKGKVIRECMEIKPVSRDEDNPFQTLLLHRMPVLYIKILSNPLPLYILCIFKIYPPKLYKPLRKLYPPC